MPITILEFRGRADRADAPATIRESAYRVLVEYGQQQLETYVVGSKYLMSVGSPTDAEIAWDAVVSCRRLASRPEAEGIFQVDANLYRVVGTIQTPIRSSESGAVHSYAVSVLGWESIDVTVGEFGGSDGQVGDYVEVLVEGLGFYAT
jgi:hypothetical protein